MSNTPTQETYLVLQRAYDHFNAAIFKGQLPQCLLTLSAESKRAHGYYRNHPFKGTSDREKSSDEIALNPFTFLNRSDREIYSTLVHEMVHLWQHHFGELETRTHHDKEWAAKMEEIGLMPSSTGNPGGKRTGRKVSHYIIEDGIFDLSEKLFKGEIPWRGAPQVIKSKGAKRIKHVCPECQIFAYTKPSCSLICGDCNQPMEVNL